MKTRARTVPSQAPSGDESFRALVEGIHTYGIFLLDHEGRFVTWNAGAQLITGYGSDEIIGRPVDLLHAPDAVARGLPRMLLNQAKERGA
jgi:PAS domain S-box-containing protein